MNRPGGRIFQSNTGHTKGLDRVTLFFCLVFPLASHLSPLAVYAGQRPSLFRGVVVADSPLGVRVVSVADSSQASLAGLRPEDIIVRVNNTDVRSIDEFAALSSALKGRAVSATVLVFRNGAPQELTLHLYSFPILQAWQIEFIPEFDIRFAEPRVGLGYWTRLGRGFEGARKLPEALNAYLNGLHNAPTDAATALKASALFSQMSRQRMAPGELADGIAQLRQSLQITERLFNVELTDAQLQAVRRQLQETLASLRDAVAAQKRKLEK